MLRRSLVTTGLASLAVCVALLTPGQASAGWTYFEDVLGHHQGEGAIYSNPWASSSYYATPRYNYAAPRYYSSPSYYSAPAYNYAAPVYYSSTPNYSYAQPRYASYARPVYSSSPRTYPVRYTYP